MSELAADGIPVSVSLRVLKLSRAHYYRWLKQSVSEAVLVEAYRADALFDAHDDDPQFGYRLLADEAREAGEPMCDRTAWKICSDNGWWSSFGKKKGRGGKRPGPPVHDDLCAYEDEHCVTRHRFTATGINELWLTDISEHPTREGKLYLCAIKDAYSGRIVGYSIDSRMKASLAVQALENAAQRRGNGDYNVICVTGVFHLIVFRVWPAVCESDGKRVQCGFPSHCPAYLAPPGWVEGPHREVQAFQCCFR